LGREILDLDRIFIPMSMTWQSCISRPSVARFVNSVFSRYLKALCLVLFISPLFSCSVVSYSLAVRDYIDIPRLEDRAISVNEKGEIPYQRYRVGPWGDEFRYVWIVGDYDFHKFNSMELILYFHGMSSKDYYRDFHKEIQALAAAALCRRLEWL